MVDCSYAASLEIRKRIGLLPDMIFMPGVPQLEKQNRPRLGQRAVKLSSTSCDHGGDL